MSSSDGQHNSVRVKLLRALYSEIPKSSNGDLQRMVDYLQGSGHAQRRGAGTSRQQWREKRRDDPARW